MSLPTLITFFIYFVVLLGIGFYFCRKSISIEDYLLGGRKMGAWVTAFSTQASDMSGWLLMGLPGAIYLSGIGNIWIAIGLFIGTVLNWKLVSARLRIYTQQTNTITLPCFFEQRFGDPTGLLRIVSAIIILIFFTIYASAQLVAAGKLFESTFGVQYKIAVIIGAGIIIIYTFLGGFLAVCWTDLFQGSLMVLALIIVPTIAYFKVGGISTIREAMTSSQKCLIPQGNGFSPLMIISMMAWGLGYFGQPHILVRFMSAKSLGKLTESMSIAIIWVILSLGGAVVIGLIGIGMFDNLDSAKGEHEKVFIYMINMVMHPWLAGIMLAAILSAIMSTIDSQLLVSSSALTEDFYQKAIKKNASQREVVLIGRICVIIISAIALALALHPEETILMIVAYAWGGFGAAFGPLVLFGLFSRKTSWQSALAGMVTGTVVLVIWKQLNLGGHLYEILPGFIANCLTIFLVNLFISQKDKRVLMQYDEVVNIITARKTLLSKTSSE
ncbi:MAG: sodium/proline symporter [Planctomycetes bacterium RBG_13_44_8b]|nr:MAG: sodium/proline symporter [Planctomycetes bacterium RBG_13_44_8b]